MPKNPPRTVDQSGRTLGPRALLTRERLLEATEELLGERSLRDLSVVEIARKVGTSPATFYQYFKDAQEATLRLAEQARVGHGNARRALLLDVAFDALLHALQPLADRL